MERSSPPASPDLSPTPTSRWCDTITDGSLDPDFGVGGIVTTHIGEGDRALSVTLQPDGRIVAAGTTRNDFVLVRYEPDGALDATFGIEGKVQSFRGRDARSVVVLPNGQILAAGLTGPFGLSDFGLLLLHPNGAVDTTFGLNGALAIDFNELNDEAYAIVSQPDGRILVGGIAAMAVGYDLRRTRESNHLRYAVNRRVAGSSPA